MSFRLKVANALASKSLLGRELGRVAELTTAVLNELVEDHAPGRLETLVGEDLPMEGDLGDRRRAMADAHSRRVSALVDVLGEEEAVRLARKRMGPAGERLGAEARTRLGVDGSMDDLVSAAELLYKVLGIEFEMEEKEGGSVTLHIGRCGLAEGYEGITCHIMSAADEGMIRGLNPHASMVFQHRMTEGADECVAHIQIDEGGDEG